MKQYLVVAAFALALAAPAHAQQLKATQVPASVVATFKQKFTQVKEVKWEKEGDKYEAGFEQGHVEVSALLSARGELLETESAMAPTQLPAAVRTRLASTYKAYKVTEAAKIVAASTGVITYEAEVMKGGKKRDILFEANGQEVNK